MEEGVRRQCPAASAGAHVDTDLGMTPAAAPSLWDQAVALAGEVDQDGMKPTSSQQPGRALGSPLHRGPPNQPPCSPLKKTNLPSCLS